MYRIFRLTKIKKMKKEYTLNFGTTQETVSVIQDSNTGKVNLAAKLDTYREEVVPNGGVFSKSDFLKYLWINFGVIAK
jgi:hypothetical protein